MTTIIYDLGNIPDWISAFFTAIAVGVAIYGVIWAHDLVQRHDKKKDALELLGTVTEHIYDYHNLLVSSYAYALLYSGEQQHYLELERTLGPKIGKLKGYIETNRHQVHESAQAEYQAWINELEIGFKKCGDALQTYAASQKETMHLQSLLKSDRTMLAALFDSEESKLLANKINEYSNFFIADQSKLSQVNPKEYEKKSGDFVVEILNMFDELFKKYHKKKWK